MKQQYNLNELLENNIREHIDDDLWQDRHDVLCVDNYFTGTKANIVHLLDDPHF